MKYTFVVTENEPQISSRGFVREGRQRKRMAVAFRLPLEFLPSCGDGYPDWAIGLDGGRGEVDALNEPRNGSGLGLSICQSIVRGLGGEILAESRPGEGTFVTVVLPTEPSVSSSHQERSIG